MLANELLNVSYWIQCIPDWGIAITAYSGLFTWKKKLSYEREMGIVDDFHEAVSDFLLKTGHIINVLSIMRIGIQNYEEIFQTDKHRQKSFVSGLHEFVSKDGEWHSSRLQTLLSDLPMQRMYLLSTKISALQMKNSDSALNCYLQLKWFYEIAQKSAGLLSMTGLYWQNPLVKEMMDPLSSLDHDALKESLSTANRLMREFAMKNYK